MSKYQAILGEAPCRGLFLGTASTDRNRRQSHPQIRLGVSTDAGLILLYPVYPNAWLDSDSERGDSRVPGSHVDSPGSEEPKIGLMH